MFSFITGDLDLQKDCKVSIGSSYIQQTQVLLLTDLFYWPLTLLWHMC